MKITSTLPLQHGADDSERGYTIEPVEYCADVDLAAMTARIIEPDARFLEHAHRVAIEEDALRLAEKADAAEQRCRAYVADVLDTARMLGAVIS